MTASNRPSVEPASALSFVSTRAVRAAAICVLLTAPLAVTGAGETTRITASANTALRQMPSAGAEVVAFLPLGSEVTDVGPAGMEKTWARVRLADNREGWILASLTRPLEPRRRWTTVEAIVQERLGRRGDAFPALVELTDFVERVGGQPTDANTRGRFAVLRLRSIAAAAAAVPLRQATRDPYLAWLDRYRASLVYDEPGGRWMLSDRAIADAYEAHAATPAADDLAWLAATNGLPGECEGQLTCYLAGSDRLYGEYLRRRPAGRHAGQAVTAIRTTVDLLAKPATPREHVRFDRGRDCGPFSKTIDALRAAVSAADAADREAALQSLTTLRTRCG